MTINTDFNLILYGRCSQHEQSFFAFISERKQTVCFTEEKMAVFELQISAAVICFP